MSVVSAEQPQLSHQEGTINDHGKDIVFPGSANGEMGPKVKALYDTLTGIQMGKIEGPEGWIVEIQ